MVYGTRYYGVLEANYSICATHLATALLGSGFWKRRITPVLSGSILARITNPSISKSRGHLASNHACAINRAAKSKPLHPMTFFIEYRPFQHCILLTGISDISLMIVSAAGVLQGCHNIYRVLWIGGNLPHEVSEAGPRAGSHNHF